MIAVVQRVTSASVDVQSENYCAEIARGVCVLLGVVEGDDEKAAEWMAKKIVHLRIFEDDAGKMNRSVQDMEGEILLISQFTLAGNCSKGHRPSFIDAAHPTVAEPLYEQVGQLLMQQHEVSTKFGVFGGDMQLTINNDGPVTLIIKSPGNAADQPA